MSEPARLEMPVTEPLPAETSPAAALPMRWHRFWIYCFVWLAAALYILRAAWFLSGRVYFDSSVRDALYAAMPAMLVMDVIYCLLLLAAAVTLIISRFTLARMNARGPLGVRVGLSFSLGGTLIYALGRLIFTGLSPFSPAILARVGGSALLLIINTSYYHKRRALFQKEGRE